MVSVSKIVVAGGAGFVGTNIVREFLSAGYSVVVMDNFILGRRHNLSEFADEQNLSIIDVDLSDLEACSNAFKNASASGGVDEVWHLAANSDIPTGVLDANVDLQHTFMTTLNILQCMEKFEIPEIFFASSSAIYGDHGSNPLRENSGPCLPISNYGAMKLASEATICAAREKFLKRAVLYRFPNVVGVPATHGVILDFVRKTIETPQRLDVLGNGTQLKSYLHVSDLVEGMIWIAKNPQEEKVEVFNLGPQDAGILVADIAKIVADNLSPKPQIFFGKEDRGWVGDVPKFNYDISKIKKIGWKPKLGSKEAVSLATKQILAQEGAGNA